MRASRSGSAFSAAASVRAALPRLTSRTSPQARAADEQRIDWLVEGRHDRVIQTMPEFHAFNPEAGFGHYLMLAGALGGERCTLRGTRMSEYESGIGTGQVHLWFDPGSRR